MLSFINKAEVAIRIHDSMMLMCQDQDFGCDVSRALLTYAGMMVETAFLFDNCEEALDGAYEKIANVLECEPLEGPIHNGAVPPATIIDYDTEQGRSLAREFFEEWVDCPFEFFEMLTFLIQQDFVKWESDTFSKGQSRSESFRLLIEMTNRAMSYELAAQELCDAVIEMRIGGGTWSMADSIAALAGMAGRKLALSHDGQNQCCWFRGSNLPDLLDQTAYVMTQEAVRLGLNSETDWRFGLPANDTPSNPPTTLIRGVDPICRGFFKAINVTDPEIQAVCCAKAAGRMLAVGAGGKKPTIEPAIAKPLAMSAITESYKSVCVEYAAAL